jgi:O-antigen biosynthesis protein
MSSFPNKLTKARRVYREHGFQALRQHTKGYVRSKVGRPEIPMSTGPVYTKAGSKLPVSLAGAASIDEVLAADWSTPRRFDTPAGNSGPLTINWVIPGAGPGSGGHQNIFRFLSDLERRGHTCRIYVHDPHDERSEAEHQRVIDAHFVDMTGPVRLLDGPMDPADAIIATSWPTAYPTYLDPSDAPRFYFVQDFEPLFYPLGSEYILAENTYRFGFRGITAGAWLSAKLQAQYGMTCSHYHFGAEPDLYSLQGEHERNAILFYARPPTPRRAFELGLLTLSLFARANPDIEIHTAGWPLKGFQTDFAYVDHGILPLEDLNALYNRMGAALVLSLTNCSLLPLELLAAGCVPVMNEGPNNDMVAVNEHVRYCPPSPHELARQLADACMASNQPGAREQFASSVKDACWEDACDRVEGALLEVVRA